MARNGAMPVPGPIRISGREGSAGKRIEPFCTCTRTNDSDRIRKKENERVMQVEERNEKGSSLKILQVILSKTTIFCLKCTRCETGQICGAQSFAMSLHHSLVFDHGNANVHLVWMNLARQRNNIKHFEISDIRWTKAQGVREARSWWRNIAVECAEPDPTSTAAAERPMENHATPKKD